MKLTPDDPKLTAYALGELDADERAVVEAALAGSPEARAAVEEIRATAGRLTSELAAEPCPDLTPAQRAALSTPAAAKVVPFPWWRAWRTAGIAAAAACVVGVMAGAIFGRKNNGKSETSLIAQANPSNSHPNREPVAAGVLSEREKMLQKLDAIHLQSVKFEFAPLAGVLSDLSQQVRLLDPEHQELSLSITGPPASLIESDLASTGIRISPPLSDVTLRQALDVIVRVADRPITYTVEAGGVVFSASAPSATNHTARPTTPLLSDAQKKVAQKLDSIRLTQIRYDSQPLAQVVDSLTRDAKNGDPERKGVNIIATGTANLGGINDDIGALTIRVEPAVNDLTLRQALEIIVKVADRPVAYTITDWGVLFSPRLPVVTELATHWYKIDPNTFFHGLEGVVAFDFGGAGSLDPSTGLPANQGQGGGVNYSSRRGGGQGGGGGRISYDPSGESPSRSGRGSAEYASVSVGNSGVSGVQERRWNETSALTGDSIDVLASQQPPEVATLRHYFRTAGVDLSPPRSVVYNDRLGMLMVRATRQELDLVEQAVQVLERKQPGNVAYSSFVENAFVSVLQEPLSTFSTDVDTASYANVRRFLNSGQLPPRDAVRIEELVNYFSYAYPAPRGDDPFSASIETAGCPWTPGHRLVRVALKGRELPRGKRPPSNFVFLIDVSGSMQPAERLPLLKQALRALVKKMTDTDRVAIVVYASEAGVKLESISCAEKEKILAVIDALEAGGSTNGGEGIQQAYAMARRHFIQGGVNRVLLCTDGDFNVGLTDQNALVALVKENAAGGVFLTTLGVGTDNYKDALMQRLADKANGNYHYLDTLEEAQKVLIEQMNANLVTIAKDVKVQVEFNPAQVSAYRLIGYEKRMLRAQDFNNDRKDAGEIGAGHTVTAFYEIVPAGAADVRPVVDKLKYQSAVAPASYSEKGESSKELLTLKLRYKQPDGDTSKLIEFPHTDSGGSYGKASGDFKFAASVASFGMILRGSEHKGSATFDTVLELAGEGKGSDEGGWRAEFINLVKKAMGLKGSGRVTFE